MNRRILFALCALAAAALLAYHYWPSPNKMGSPGKAVLKGSGTTWMLEWTAPANASLFPDLNYGVTITDNSNNIVQASSATETSVQLLPNGAAPGYGTSWNVQVIAASAQANEFSPPSNATVQVPQSPKVTAASFVQPLAPASGSLQINYTASPPTASVIAKVLLDNLNQGVIQTYTGNCAGGLCTFGGPFPAALTAPGVVVIGDVQDAGGLNPDVKVQGTIPWPSIGAIGDIHLVQQ